jgi:hypothetical protein
MIRINLLLVGIVLLLVSRAQAYDDGDFQVWNTDLEEFEINQDSKITLEEEFRWADNANEFYYHHYDIGYFHGLNKNLNIIGGYRHVYELKKGKFKLENAPYITVTLLWDLKGFKCEDRNRIEYRHFDYQADSGRYRNKFTLKLPWKFTKIAIQPYVADEAFFGFGGTSRFNQNRFSSGFAMSLAKNIKAEIYYMLQSSRAKSEWVDTNILGTKLKITF